jgi:hypothetical protein
MTNETNENEISRFIEKAIEKNTPVESMEKLFSLFKAVKAEKAKEEYTNALSKFQSEIPVIEKTKKVLNRDGSVRYTYAPLEDEIKQIKKYITDNEFAYSWNTENAEGKMKVTCKLSHRGGHSEESSFEIPITESQFMTSSQSYASAQTFAKRYTLNNILGIGTAEEDNDATTTEKEVDVKSEKSKIMLLLRQLEYETNTAEQIKKAVKDITKLDLVEKNYKKIIEELERSVANIETDIYENN